MTTTGTQITGDGRDYLLPSSQWDDLKPTGHSVQFYQDDSFLLEGLCRFVGGAIASGDAALVIATEAHRNGLRERLEASGFDLSVPIQQGRYLTLDAAETLAQFMVDGHPEPSRFEDVVGTVLSRLGAGVPNREHRIVAFGEMVSLLWADGNAGAAIQLEQLWNQLLEKYSFHLHCAYPLNLFPLPGDAAEVERICREHSHVAPSESYASLHTGEERLRVIAVLQQKAMVLENEVREREKAQQELQKRESELTDFLENAVVAMHWVAGDGTILWANKAELSLLGYDANEYIGHHIAEFHADDDVIDDILERLQRNEELHGRRARLRCKNGDIREVRIHSNVCWEHGKFVHTRCFSIDVTEAERSQRRIAAQQAITGLLSQADSLDDVAVSILKAVCSGSECDLGAVWLVEGDQIHCKTIWSRSGKQFPHLKAATQSQVFSRGQGLPGRIWAGNRPVWIEDIGVDDNLPRLAKALHDGMRTALGFPISTGRGAVGAIEFFSARMRKKDEEFMNMMAAVGSQIGQFIERKRAEQALRQSEERFRAIFETTPECVKVVAPDGTLLHMNAAGFAMIGADSPDIAIGKNIYDVIAPEDRERFRIFNESICRGEKGELEFDIIGFNGVRRHMESHAAPLQNGNGSFVHLAVTSDITARRVSEKALRESEQRFRVITEASPIMVWMSGTDKLCFYFNKGWLEFVGRTLEQELGNGWAENVHPEDFDRCLQIYVSSFDARRPFEMQYRLRHHSGEYRWILDHGVPRYAPDGTFEGYVGGCLDIHDQKVAAEQLNAALADAHRLAAIVESSDDAIASKDLKGVVTSWNKGAERLFGYTPDEIIGSPIKLIIPSELHADEEMILGRIRAGEKIHHFETIRLNKSGEPIDVSLTVSPLKDEHGDIIGAATIARDITQRKKIEKALRTTEKLAAAGRLAATVAHEINNPLESVTNLVYLAKRDLPDAARAKKHLELAGKELDRVAHIARQTLGFYRDTSSPAPVFVTEMLDGLLSLYEKRLEGRDIKVVRRYNDKKAEIIALPGEIRQAFSNLISNALDAMPGGGSLTLKLTRASDPKYPDRPGVRITVADTGQGIEWQHRKSLFQPFFTTKADVGTGLGLWITHGIVDKHHGYIRFRSRTGPDVHGTVFSIFLPFDSQAARPALVGTPDVSWRHIFNGVAS